MSVTKFEKFSKGPYEGRDKLAKFMQFGSKFLAYYIMTKDPKNERAQKLMAFDKNIGMARKGLRLGKSVEPFQKLIVTMGSEAAPLDMALEAVSCIGMFFRWGYDNLSFLEKAKVLPAGNYSLTSNQWRVMAGVAYVISAIRELIKCQVAAEKAAMDDKASAHALNKRLEASLQLIAKVCDLINALHGANMYKTNEGLQGLAGATNAFIALRKSWLAVK